METNKELTDAQKVQIFDELVSGAEKIKAGEEEGMKDLSRQSQAVVSIATNYFLEAVKRRKEQLQNGK